MLVETRYQLDPSLVQRYRQRPVSWGFGLLSEATYYRTYSRSDPEYGRQEQWVDTVARNVSGVLSIWIDHQRKIGRRVHEAAMAVLAERLFDAIFNFRFLPPGRSLFAQGIEYVFERGSHALNNCAFVSVQRSLADAANFLMDSLMCGVGVGFDTHRAQLQLHAKEQKDPIRYTIPDSREGWVNATSMLLRSYELSSRAPVVFDYSQIRPAGSPIHGFGGTASGSAPLEQLHQRIRGYCEQALRGEIDQTRLIVDVMNAIGACVVAGNVRRSAEIALGAPSDSTFLNLKNYELYPERAEIGWMSNNSLVLAEPADFLRLPDLAERVQDNGEPGFLNLMNVQKYGRIGEVELDLATGINPCGEIPLESAELCNLVEVFPTRCASDTQFLETLELATFYATAVSLLPSHRDDTNLVVGRNHRIGVSVSGVADWIDSASAAHVFSLLNTGYEQVKRSNRALCEAARIPASIRVTTVKPSGTVSLLAGVSPGMHWPTDSFVLRRMRVSQASPLVEILSAAGLRHEPDVYSAATEVFEFPLAFNAGKTRSVKRVSLAEQAGTVAALGKFWADNAVSNTLSFHRGDDVEGVLARFAPFVKSISLLPIDDSAYPQMPYESLGKATYLERLGTIGEVDWTGFVGNDVDASEANAYCTNDVCELPQQ